MTTNGWTELDELLLRRSTGEASPEELARLNDVIGEHSEDSEWLDRMVGELDAQWATAGEAVLPDELRIRLLEGAADGTEFGKRAGDSSGAGISQGKEYGLQRSRLFGWTGWIAAAGIVLVWLGSPDADAPLAEGTLPENPVTRILQRAAAGEVLTVAWTATDDPTAENAQGEVVWDPELQEGVMRFAGIEANDPSEFQYQLWIFDADRDDRFPVDGGVFDIPPGSDEVVVPIRARLPVSDAALFAVTVEAPGGVVVSDRSRIAVLAQVPIA